MMDAYMNPVHFEIQLVDEWNTNDIIRLYREGKWWKEGSDPSIIPLLIKNSYAFAVAIVKDSRHAIGMGRVLSDGISDAYIQDVVVQKDFRKNGVGRRIIQTLIEHCIIHQVTWIALISEPHQDGFYQSIGFQEMKEYIPMKYKL